MQNGDFIFPGAFSADWQNKLKDGRIRIAFKALTERQHVRQDLQDTQDGIL